MIRLGFHPRKLPLVLSLLVLPYWAYLQPDTLLNFLHPFIGEWYTDLNQDDQQASSAKAPDIGFKFLWGHENKKLLRFYEGIPGGDMNQRIVEFIVAPNPRTGSVEFLGYQMRNDFLFKGRFEPMEDEKGFIRLYDVYYPPGTAFRNKRDEMKGMKSYRDVCRLLGPDTLECTTEQLDFGIYKAWGNGAPYRLLRKDKSQLPAKIASQPMPQWLIEDWNNRTENGGIWTADNAAYQSEGEPYDAYGMEWSYGLGKQHLQGRLYAIKDDMDVGTIWQFTEYWDAQVGQVRIVQLGADGTAGRGTLWKESNGHIKERQTFASPNGNSFESGHEVWFEAGKQHTQSYTIVDGKWEKRRFYIWEKSANSTMLEVPEEYQGLSFLIGEWQSSFGDSKARMTFGWGKNKRNIHFRNQYKPGKDAAWVQENEGLISYHAVKNKLVFLTSYSKKSTHLMAEGEYIIKTDGTIIRQFTCHYKAGDKLPWSDGATAPAGGKSIAFKQIWTPVDQNTFQGKFYWEKDGLWLNPMGKDLSTEVWKRMSK